MKIVIGIDREVYIDVGYVPFSNLEIIVCGIASMQWVGDANTYVKLNDIIAQLLLDASKGPPHARFARCSMALASVYQGVLHSVQVRGGTAVTDDFIVAMVDYLQAKGDEKSASKIRRDNPNVSFNSHRDFVLPKEKRKRDSRDKQSNGKHVYFFQGIDTNNVKIGVSKDAQSRLKALQTSEGLIMLKQIRGDESLERQLHTKFGHLRLHGEWFRGDDELLTYIKKLES